MARQCLDDPCQYPATHGPADSNRPWSCYFHAPKGWREVTLTDVEDARVAVQADRDMEAHDFLQGEDQ